MSVQQTELSAEEDDDEFEKYFTVFDGSSPENVSYAKQMWNSVWLPPPQESRLVSADIRQRLPVARAHRDHAGGAYRCGPKTPGPERLDLVVNAPLQRRREEKQRYLAMANQREEILALLMRQREQRTQLEKELVSFSAQQEGTGGHRGEPSLELEMDKAIVKQLQ